MKMSGLLEKAKKMNRRFVLCSVLIIVLGLIGIAYDVYLITSCPGTFWDNVISFTHIWSAAGLYLIFTGMPLTIRITSSAAWATYWFIQP